MWIFLRESFLSIVQHRDDPSLLMVRARLPGDIERAFPAAEVTETPTADYRFRTTLPREQVATAMQKQLLTVDYPNFKSAVPDHDRHDTYMEVWQVMVRAQDRARPPIVSAARAVKIPTTRSAAPKRKTSKKRR